MVGTGAIPETLYVDTDFSYSGALPPHNSISKPSASRNCVSPRHTFGSNVLQLAFEEPSSNNDLNGVDAIDFNADYSSNSSHAACVFSISGSPRKHKPAARDCVGVCPIPANLEAVPSSPRASPSQDSSQDLPQIRTSPATIAPAGSYAIGYNH